MPSLPAKTATRIAAELKRFQPILESARSRDVNESDTVVIVTDLLQYVFGYDKYSEITSEHMIRGTFCDLAVKLDGKLALLIEVKAIGLDLKEGFVKQAVDYATNQGCDWVVLTNGVIWRAYKVHFTKPITQELVVNLDLLAVSHKRAEDIEMLGLLSKEGWLRSHLEDYNNQRQALSRYTLGAIMLSEPVLAVLRREIRKLSPDVKVTVEDVAAVLHGEVLKREVLEGEKADEAKKLLKRAQKQAIRASATKESDEPKPEGDSSAGEATSE